MLKLIKTFIGNLTLPKEVYVCQLGDYWIETLGIPAYNEIWERTVIDYSYPYSYQQIEQNWYGKWIKKDCWLGKNTPLKLKG